MEPSTESQQPPTPQEAESPFFPGPDSLSDTPFQQPSPTSYANHSTSWTPVDAMTPVSTNPSRKRSRDETTLDSDYELSSQQINSPAPIPEEEPVYGEGMVLLNPQTGMSISAESQTGTWYEEKVEEEAKAVQEAQSRPQMRTRKSIRLDSTASLPRFDDILHRQHVAAGSDFGTALG